MAVSVTIVWSLTKIDFESLKHTGCVLSSESVGEPVVQTPKAVIYLHSSSYKSSPITALDSHNCNAIYVCFSSKLQ